jgi:hypothetical protein
MPVWVLRLDRSYLPATGSGKSSISVSARSIASSILTCATGKSRANPPKSNGRGLPFARESISSYSAKRYGEASCASGRTGRFHAAQPVGVAVQLPPQRRRPRIPRGGRARRIDVLESLLRPNPLPAILRPLLTRFAWQIRTRLDERPSRAANDGCWPRRRLVC